ncbi:MAG: hypothetical protein ACRC76_15030 [Proteocatella sp.]
MKKKIWKYTDGEMEDLAGAAAKEEIAKTHAAGRPSTHGDEKGVYHLFPDGHKEYIKIY